MWPEALRGLHPHALREVRLVFHVLLGKRLEMRRDHDREGRTVRPQAEDIAHAEAEAVARLLLVRPDGCITLEELERLDAGEDASLKSGAHILHVAGAVELGDGMVAACYASPFWEAFRGAEAGAENPVPLLRQAFSGMDGVEAVFVFGSFADGSAGPDSDIDVLVIGDRTSGRVYWCRTNEVGLILDRAVNAVQYSREMLLERIRDTGHPAHPFVRRVLGGAKAWLVGSDQHLAEIVGGGVCQNSRRDVSFLAFPQRGVASSP
jgi:predicted nucleotidyltransferase